MTSTKQFVCLHGARLEERDGAGLLTKSFFSKGQLNGSTKLFYCKSMVGSIQEVTDNSGNLECKLTFDPYGRCTQTSTTSGPDFQYAGYYFHTPSGLSLTSTRAYNANIGRFINRDLVEAANPYRYVYGNPISLRDSSGLGPGPTPGDIICDCTPGQSSPNKYRLEPDTLALHIAKRHAPWVVPLFNDEPRGVFSVEAWFANNVDDTIKHFVCDYKTATDLVTQPGKKAGYLAITGAFYPLVTWMGIPVLGPFGVGSIWGPKGGFPKGTQEMTLVLDTTNKSVVTFYPDGPYP